MRKLVLPKDKKKADRLIGLLFMDEKASIKILGCFVLYSFSHVQLQRPSFWLLLLKLSAI